ncbi:MAG: helix-turn-helix transcriptional regulator [Clostridia bacterium]|nr:helix-turn-helix transcriptional regulator [Clostridia bacterium]
MEDVDFWVGTVAFAYHRSYPPRHLLQMKKRPHHGLTLVLSGELRISYADGERTVARAHDILIQHRGDDYLLETPAEIGAEYIVISYLAEPEEIPVELMPEGPVYTPVHQRRYTDAFERAAKVYAARGVCTAALLRALVQQILCNLIREYRTEPLGSADDPAACARRYIETHFDRALTAKEIARQSCSSVSYLRILFRRAYGDSPMHYLNRIRIERAKEMLSSDLFRIDEVATACGFQNVYYFSRVFKSFTGVPPGKY